MVAVPERPQRDAFARELTDVGNVCSAPCLGVSFCVLPHDPDLFGLERIDEVRRMCRHKDLRRVRRASRAACELAGESLHEPDVEAVLRFLDSDERSRLWI